MTYHFRALENLGTRARVMRAGVVAWDAIAGVARRQQPPRFRDVHSLRNRAAARSGLIFDVV